MAGFRSTQ